MKLTVKELTYTYRGGHTALRNISFAARQGELLSVLGPNGAGKSTLFRCILGGLPDYGGAILLDGRDARTLDQRALAAHIAYIPQIHRPTFGYSVLDTVLMGLTRQLSPFRSPSAQQEQQALATLEQLGVVHLTYRNFAELSGGEQQLVLIARALCQQADILVMDEPTSSLDYGNQLRVLRCVHDLSRQGYTVVLSTQDPQHALRFSDRVLAAAPDVVIDVGEPKGSIVEDMDELQEQTGIPFVHIDAYLSSMDDTYAMLGDLLAMPNEAQGRADYCRFAYDRIVSIADSVDKVNLLYITGDEGLNVIAQDSFHAEVIDLLSNNLAVVDEPSSKGTGNEVDMEQILNWNPDVILFAPGSIYDTVAGNENWQTISAIQSGKYYEVPMGPYNWMGFPPSVQRLLGMTWMAKVLYPEAADYDLYTEVSTYFELFYHCDLTQAQYDALVANSIPAASAADQAA